MTKKEKCFAVFIGCASFAIFALILEGTCNALILGGGRAASLMQKPLLFGLYGGLMAGLFEETGRFVAFKTLLKKTKEHNSTALYYGAGHAGLELLYIIIASIISIVLTNKMQTQVEVQTPLMYILGIVERIAAITIHITLSIAVWFTAKNRKQLYLYPLAILIHAFVDAMAGALSLMKINAVIIELVVCILVIPLVCFAIVLWKRNSNTKIESEV